MSAQDERWPHAFRRAVMNAEQFVALTRDAERAFKGKAFKTAAEIDIVDQAVRDARDRVAANEASAAAEGGQTGAAA